MTASKQVVGSGLVVTVVEVVGLTKARNAALGVRAAAGPVLATELTAIEKRLVEALVLLPPLARW
jgi:hypothetical protein